RLAAATAGLFTVAGNLDIVTFVAQVELEPQRDIGFVFDHEDSRHSIYPFTGRTIVNVLPLPGSLSTSTHPWCAFTISSTMARPIPVPLMPRVRACSPR